MYSRVFVVVPMSVPPADIWRTALASLELHEQGHPQQTLEARFDRRAGWPGRLSDPVAEGLLPAREKRVLHRRIAIVRHVPADQIPNALLLPSGAWHDVRDFGWRMMGEDSVNTRAIAEWQALYHRLLLDHQDDYLLDTWVHS